MGMQPRAEGWKGPERRHVRGPKTYELPFPVAEYRQRQERIRGAMEKAGVDACLVMAPRDFHWLTGTRVDYWASESPQWAIVWSGEPVGIVRHLEASTHRCCSFLERWMEYPDAGPINPYDPVRHTVQALRELGLADKRIGVNLRILPVEEYTWLREQLPGAKFVDFRVERIRVRRSPAEIDCIRRAARVNQEAMAATIEAMRPGWSEWGVLTYVARRHAELLGDDYARSAWGNTCCQVGRHMIHMHAIRTPEEMRRQKIRRNDGVWLEPGVFVNEYVGCMIRTIWFGEPPEIVRRAIDAVCEAFDRMVPLIRPGARAGDVDAAARGDLTRLGFDMQHRSGYMSNEKWMDGGILSLTPDNPLVLESGQVFHCPMHVHLPEIGYVGVSEQVLVTDDGCDVLGDHGRKVERRLYVKT